MVTRSTQYRACGLGASSPNNAAGLDGLRLSKKDSPAMSPISPIPLEYFFPDNFPDCLVRKAHM